MSHLPRSSQRKGRCKRLRIVSPESACTWKVQAATSFRYSCGTQAKRQFSAAPNHWCLFTAFNENDEIRARKIRVVRRTSACTARCARQLSPFEAREDRVPRVSSDGIWARTVHVRATAWLHDLSSSGACAGEMHFVSQDFRDCTSEKCERNSDCTGACTKTAHSRVLSCDACKQKMRRLSHNACESRTGRNESNVQRLSRRSSCCQ